MEYIQGKLKTKSYTRQKMMYFNYFILSIIILCLLFSCEYGKPYKEETTVVFNGQPYKCISEKLNGVWHGETLCWDSTGNLFLSQTLVHGNIHGEFIIYYPEGSKHRVQKYHHGKPENVMRYYYPNGVLKMYEFFDSVSGNPIYARKYDYDGIASYVLFPIDIRIIEPDPPNLFGDSVLIEIELLHSEFDNSFICVVIEQDPGDYCFSGSETERLKTQYLIKPGSNGRIFLSGVLFEFLPPEEYMGEYPFEFEYYINGSTKDTGTENNL